MSCLISFVWDQPTCQERVESDKIENEKFLLTVDRTHNLESICYDNGRFLPGVQPSISVTL